MDKTERHPNVTLVDMDEEHSSPLHFAIMENDVSGAVLRAAHVHDTQAVKQFAFDGLASRKSSED